LDRATIGALLAGDDAVVTVVLDSCGLVPRIAPGVVRAVRSLRKSGTPITPGAIVATLNGDRAHLTAADLEAARQEHAAGPYATDPGLLGDRIRAATVSALLEHTFRASAAALADGGDPAIVAADVSEELRAVAPRASRGPSGGLALRTASELLADDNLASDLAWVVRGLVPVGLTILFGRPKVGKSTLAMYLAGQVVAGQPALERDTTPGPVLWIDLEVGFRMMRRKVAECGAGDGPHPFHIYSGLAPDLLRIEAAARALASRLIVVDSASRLLRLEDENDNAEVTAKLAPVAEMAHRLDVGIMAIHHAGKRDADEHGGNLRGASAFAAVADVLIEVGRDPDNADESARRLKLVSRYDECNDRRLWVSRNAVSPLGEGTTDRITYRVHSSPEQARRERLAGAVTTEPATADAIAERLGLTRTAILADLTELLARRVVSVSGSGRKGDPKMYGRMLSGTPTVGSETE
jgi:hypothetical protein